MLALHPIHQLGTPLRGSLYTVSWGPWGDEHGVPTFLGAAALGHSLASQCLANRQSCRLGKDFRRGAEMLLVLQLDSLVSGSFQPPVPFTAYTKLSPKGHAHFALC